MTSTFKLTLNRAHKVAERLRTYVKELQKVIQDKSTPLAIRSLREASVIQKAKEQSESFDHSVNQYLNASEALEKLRNAIAAGNHQSNVYLLISKQNRLNLEVQALTQALEYAQNASGVALSDIPDTPQEYQSYRLETLNSTQVASLRQRVAQLQRECHVVADDISDANRFTIEVELSDELSQVVGLKV